MFGQVINRARNIADFGQNRGKGCGKLASLLYPIFLEVRLALAFLV